MQPEAPDILGGGGVAEFGLGISFEQVAVVIEAQQLNVRQPSAVQSGSEEFADELRLLLRAVGAGFPSLVGVGLVLHGKGPDRDTFFLGHGLDKFDINIGPGRTVFPAE